MELMKEQRDYKRRRQSYRAKNTHITKRTPVQISRDVLAGRMRYVFPDEWARLQAAQEAHRVRLLREAAEREALLLAEQHRPGHDRCAVECELSFLFLFYFHHSFFILFLVGFFFFVFLLVIILLRRRDEKDERDRDREPDGRYRNKGTLLSCSNLSVLVLIVCCQMRTAVEIAIVNEIENENVIEIEIGTCVTKTGRVIGKITETRRKSWSQASVPTQCETKKDTAKAKGASAIRKKITKTSARTRRAALAMTATATVIETGIGIGIGAAIVSWIETRSGSAIVIVIESRKKSWSPASSLVSASMIVIEAAAAASITTAIVSAIKPPKTEMTASVHETRRSRTPKRKNPPILARLQLLLPLVLLWLQQWMYSNQRTWLNCEPTEFWN